MKKQFKNRKIILLTSFSALVVLVLLVFPGRKKENNENASVDKVEISTNIPAEFPKSFPLPDDAKLVDSSVKEGETKKGISIVFISQESSAVLENYYKVELEKNGWSYEVVRESEEFATYNIDKGNYRGFLGIVQGESGNIISVTIGIE